MVSDDPNMQTLQSPDPLEEKPLGEVVPHRPGTGREWEYVHRRTLSRIREQGKTGKLES